MKAHMTPSLWTPQTLWAQQRCCSKRSGRQSLPQLPAVRSSEACPEGCDGDTNDVIIVHLRACYSRM